MFFMQHHTDMMTVIYQEKINALYASVSRVISSAMITTIRPFRKHSMNACTFPRIVSLKVC